MGEALINYYQMDELPDFPQLGWIVDGAVLSNLENGISISSGDDPVMVNGILYPLGPQS
tara:strand:- start:4797 stop:4973 length:177 start_codon:yes stop_codon:yes gene_type:complete